MAIYKRKDSKFYWYEFQFKDERVRETTHQTNPRVARQMESAHRTALAKGEVGIRDKKKAPTLKQFAEGAFLLHVRSTFAEKLKTLEYYENGSKNLLAFDELAQRPLDTIKAQHITAYVVRRQARGLKVSSINRELQVLRRMFKLAMEWG